MRKEETKMKTNPNVTSHALIDEFLSCKRIAVVGVSRSRTGFASSVHNELKSRGYTAVPVNPKAAVDGHEFFASVRDISPPPEAALLIIPPQAVKSVVQDCAAAGVPLVWIHGYSGTVDGEIAELGSKHGMRVIGGQCPHMFLSNPKFVHRLHGFVLKLAGKYPA